MSNVARIYVVKLGDTLNSVAQQFGTDAAMIADANNLNVNAVLPLGQRLAIPALGVPATITQDADGLEEVLVTAPAWVWYKDWRVWAGGLAMLGVLWFATRGRK